MSQNGRLLHFLETHPEGITQLEPFNTLGCCRLSERVRETRKLIRPMGLDISDVWETTQGGARVKRYFLVHAPEVVVTRRATSAVAEFTEQVAA